MSNNYPSRARGPGRASRDPVAVLIPSRGYADARPTRHLFVRLESVPADRLVGTAPVSPAGAPPPPAHGLVYRCLETGAERRYGIE